MADIVDLDKERRIAASLQRIGDVLTMHPELTDRTFQYLNGELPAMPEPEKETLVISLKVSPQTNERLQSLAERLSGVKGFAPGRPRRAITRASVIREALAIGMDALDRLVDGAEADDKKGTETGV
ncbi:MAG: hypothetical protein HQL87_07675 [Magnetococcales bacterium]|nr:hypothetical protein [Magnetococcales bacterium]